jgi:hypothetical protein
LLIGCVRRRAAQKEQKSNFPISREDFSKRISTELFLFINSIDGFGTKRIGVLLFMFATIRRQTWFWYKKDWCTLVYVCNNKKANNFKSGFVIYVLAKDR